MLGNLSAYFIRNYKNISFSLVNIIVLYSLFAAMGAFQCTYPQSNLFCCRNYCYYMFNCFYHVNRYILQKLENMMDHVYVGLKELIQNIIFENLIHFVYLYHLIDKMLQNNGVIIRDGWLLNV
jgi:hypothetical protein